MINLYYNNNFYNNVIRDEKVFSRVEFQEFRQTMQQEMQEMMESMHMGLIRNRMDNLVHNDDGIRVRHTRHQRLAPINRPLIYEDLSDDDVSCVRPVSNHIYELQNRKLIYEENVSYNEKVELPSKKQYVQLQQLVPATVPVEEYPLQVHLNTITTKINNKGDSFEKDNKVEDEIEKKIFREIFME